MKNFTFIDYKHALDGAGPKTTENILMRAIADPGISFEELVSLENAADFYQLRRERTTKERSTSWTKQRPHFGSKILRAPSSRSTGTKSSDASNTAS